MIIYLGNKNYSSWSLRAWLAVKASGMPFDEVVIPLDEPEAQTSIRRHSPAGRVPVLHHDGLVVWDSLAIGEYMAELAPQCRLLPEDRAARARARVAVAEMHSGFQALRTHLPMNIRASYPDREIPAPVQVDIDRIQALWRALRSEVAAAAGPFLFGTPSLADFAYAPVVARFRTYGVELDAANRAYADAVWSMPSMQEWVEAARQEPMVIERYKL